MPSPGYIAGQVVTQEALSQDHGTITVGTVNALQPSFATLGGSYSLSTLSVVGAILRSQKLSVIDSASAGEVSGDTGSIVGARVVGTGFALGTLVGTIGTIGPAANNILVELFTVGTVASGGVLPTQKVADGTVVKGSINVIEVGR